MRNDAVVRAIELLSGAEVARCDTPELMGAFGCALYAMKHQGESVSLDEIINKAQYSARSLYCKSCDNRCLVIRYEFESGKSYYSGNRCEKVFTNGESSNRKGLECLSAKRRAFVSSQRRDCSTRADYRNPPMSEYVRGISILAHSFHFLWHTSLFV